MPAFERLPDTDDHFDLSAQRDSASAAASKAKTLANRKSRTTSVHPASTSTGLSPLPPSPAESMMAQNEAGGGLDMTDLERDRITNHIERGAPGDAAIFSDKKTVEQREVAARRSQYYNDEFAYREPLTSSRERILKESVVIAEVKTNVIVNDEYTFITDLSYQLSNRYQRPESSILVTVHHSTCFLFAGSFEPAYALTITALPSLVQPMTNRRNAALLSKSLEEALSVPASRGIIKFLGVAEENFACDGTTYAGAISELERTSNESANGVKRPASRASKARRRSSMRSLKNLKIGFGGGGDRKGELLDDERITPPASLRDAAGSPPVPPMPTGKSDMDRRAEKAQQLGKRKSLMSMFRGKGKDA